MQCIKSACQKDVAAVMANAPYNNRYERLYAANGQYYFNLKAATGEVVGTSEMYTSSNSRDHGIELVKVQAPEAQVIDRT